MCSASLLFFLCSCALSALLPDLHLLYSGSYKCPAALADGAFGTFPQRPDCAPPATPDAQPCRVVTVLSDGTVVAEQVRRSPAPPPSPDRLVVTDGSLRVTSSWWWPDFSRSC